MDGSMRRVKDTNRRLDWWGPSQRYDNVVMYQCPTNLTVDSDFNSSSHCPVNSYGALPDLTVDTTLAYSSSGFTTVD
jgi:hypothetical protein